MSDFIECFLFASRTEANTAVLYAVWSS